MSTPIVTDIVTTIVTFDPQYLSAFIALNREWIEKYFVLEPMDLYQLENAQESILDKGGEILFVLEDKNVVATCALVPHGPHAYELAKMAVAPQMRGRGHGDTIIKAAIDWAQAHEAQELILLSNTILEPAITLYKKHGFVTTHLGQHPDYQRANIEMKLALSPQKS